MEPIRGNRIELVQEKTKKFVVVPAHKELKAYLDGLDRGNVIPINDERPIIGPVNFLTLRGQELKLRRELEIAHLQMRDLRRTGMVRMKEAGADVEDIAAVSGHTIEKTRKILETYLPRTEKMARRAMKKWEDESRTDF